MAWTQSARAGSPSRMSAARYSSRSARASVRVRVAQLHRAHAIAGGADQQTSERAATRSSRRSACRRHGGGKRTDSCRGPRRPRKRGSATHSPPRRWPSSHRRPRCRLARRRSSRQAAWNSRGETPTMALKRRCRWCGLIEATRPSLASVTASSAWADRYADTRRTASMPGHADVDEVRLAALAGAEALAAGPRRRCRRTSRGRRAADGWGSSAGSRRRLTSPRRRTCHRRRRRGRPAPSTARRGRRERSWQSIHAASCPPRYASG